MSAKKVLLVFKDGEEQRIPLEKEKILIGRDKACDVVLAHSSISRRHVAVFNRFETVYVENVSSSGQVLRGGDPIEQAELNEGEEVQVGPFSLCWRRADSLSPEAAAPKNEGSSFAAESAPNEAESMIPANEGEAISADAPPSEGEVEGARTVAVLRLRPSLRSGLRSGRTDRDSGGRARLGTPEARRS